MQVKSMEWKQVEVMSKRLEYKEQEMFVKEGQGQTIAKIERLKQDMAKAKH